MRHQPGSVQTHDGLTLYTQAWLPEGTSEAAVVLAHGYAEHSSRYLHVAEHLANHGYAVFAIDHRGHGRSEGHRANIMRFGDYVTDLSAFIASVREQHPDVYLYGHSAGGSLAALYALEHPGSLRGLIFSSPYLVNAVPVPGFLLSAAHFLSRILPHLPVQAFDKRGLSRDPEVVRAFAADALAYQGKVKTRIGVEMLAAGRDVLARADQLTLPTLVIHGTADPIADVTGSRQLFARLGAQDKHLKLYEGCYHEPHNDLDKQDVLADVVGWLEERVGS